MQTVNAKMFLLAVILAAFGASPASAANKVLFYMHGSDMHGKSESHKNAENYKKLVSYLSKKGFDVVFEFRTNRDAEAEAARTAMMVKEKIASGTPAEDIYITGFSYGAMISLKAAGLVGNDKINIGLFCGCPESPSIPVDIDYAAVKGRVLAIVDTDDGKFGSCKGKLPNASGYKEQEITSGKGHKIFKLGKDKFIQAWAPIFMDWAK